MAFDGVVAFAVALELSRRLEGGKIDKIYQPEKDDLLLHVSRGRDKHKLFISSAGASPRIHLAGERGPNPQNPAGFCMLLRKHIQGGRISEIRQKDTERIVEISVDTISELGFSQNKKLIVEIMGKHSNITLTDSRSGKIIDSIKRLSRDVNRYRQTLPGNAYVYPPSHGKFPLFSVTEADIAAFMPGEAPDVSGAVLANIMGIGPLLAAEIAARAAKTQAGSPPEAVYLALSEFTAKMRAEDFSPRVYLDSDGKPADFHVFPVSSLEDARALTDFEEISAAIDYYFTNRISSNRVRQKSTDLSKTVCDRLAKLNLKKRKLYEDLSKAENAHENKLYGELLTANLYAVPLRGPSVTLNNYYDGSSVEIRLDPRLTPAQNAQRYYKIYRKAKTAVVQKKTQIEESDREIAYLESVLSYIENSTSLDEIEGLRLELTESGYLRRRGRPVKSRPEKPVFRAHATGDGLTVLAGRNNRENDILTFKKASPKDIWFHAKNIPGSHVILLTGGNEAPEDSIREAAAIAAYYSKGRESENVPVDYTLARNVKKPAGARPGMVIFTNNRTIYASPKADSLD